MKIQYNFLYKFEKLPEDSEEYLVGRIDALTWELSLKNHLGCIDIKMPESEKIKYKEQYEAASKRYTERVKLLEDLVSLIKEKTNPKEKSEDGQYLYELWISRVFSLDWSENYDWKEVNNKPEMDLKTLYNELSINSKLNPFDINLEEQRKKYIDAEKELIKLNPIQKIIRRFKKKK